jgi:hypothetical protein
MSCNPIQYQPALLWSIFLPRRRCSLHVSILLISSQRRLSDECGLAPTHGDMYPGAVGASPFDVISGSNLQFAWDGFNQAMPGSQSTSSMPVCKSSPDCLLWLLFSKLTNGPRP